MRRPRDPCSWDRGRSVVMTVGRSQSWRYPRIWKSFSLAQSVSLPQLSELVANTPDWQRALCKRRGVERVPWNPRDAVVEALLPHKLRPIDALPQLPLLPVSQGQEELVLRGGAAPPPPVGVRPGDRYLVVRDDKLAALVESQGGGRATVLWRATGNHR